MSIKEAALAYHAQGLNVVPIGQDKKALVKWTRYQSEHQRRSTVAGLFNKFKSANVAVVLGPVSGQDGQALVCRDFDVMDAYSQWSRENPALALELPTSSGSRGRHVFFMTNDGVRSKNFDDGELKALGALAVLPPSIHASGVRYQWQNPLIGTYPKVDAAVFLKAYCQGLTQESARDPRRSQENTGRLADSANRRAKIPRNLEEAIGANLPSGEGERHYRLFGFIRALKSMLQYEDADPRRLWAEFEAWFERAESFIGTKEIGVSWDDFLDGWSRVRFKLGEGFMSTIIEKAGQREIPEFAKRFKGSEQVIGGLINLCAELQEFSGVRPFPLSARKAAEAISVDRDTAWRYMRILEREGLIKCVVRGKQGPRQPATTWRFIGVDSHME